MYFPDNVKTIKGSALMGCTYLQTVRLPRSLENLGGYVFQQCSQLWNIALPSNTINFGVTPFAACDPLLTAADGYLSTVWHRAIILTVRGERAARMNTRSEATSAITTLRRFAPRWTLSVLLTFIYLTLITNNNRYAKILTSTSTLRTKTKRTSS